MASMGAVASTGEVQGQLVPAELLSVNFIGIAVMNFQLVAGTG